MKKKDQGRTPAEVIATFLPLDDIRRLIREEVERQLAERFNKAGAVPFTNRIHTKRSTA